MKYIVLTFVLILCSCGSVRHNKAVLKDCQERAEWYKKIYSHTLIREQTYKQRADSLQYVIWCLESDIDSLERALRGYMFVHESRTKNTSEYRKDW